MRLGCEEPRLVLPRNLEVRVAVFLLVHFNFNGDALDDVDDFTAGHSHVSGSFHQIVGELVRALRCYDQGIPYGFLF